MVGTFNIGTWNGRGWDIWAWMHHRAQRQKPTAWCFESVGLKPSQGRSGGLLFYVLILGDCTSPNQVHVDDNQYIYIYQVYPQWRWGLIRRTFTKPWWSIALATQPGIMIPGGDLTRLEFSEEKWVKHRHIFICLVLPLEIHIISG